jgi:hypothetical protein
MIESNQVSGLADVAEAAYINFDPVPQGGWRDDDLATQLRKSESVWPVARRDEFIKHWRVVAHQPNTASGFSGTLFERIDPQPGEARFVVAMRGTEASSFTVNTFYDLASADFGDLVLDGLAWKQAVDMYHWWQRISTPQGEYCRQVVAVPTVSGPFKAYEGFYNPTLGPLNLLSRQGFRFDIVASGIEGQGLVPEGTTVDVTGHSLGGWASAKSLGITLDDAPPPPPTPSNSFAGEFAKQTGSGSSSTYYQFDGLGNYVGSGALGSARGDVMDSTWGNAWLPPGIGGTPVLHHA